MQGGFFKGFMGRVWGLEEWGGEKGQDSELVAEKCSVIALIGLSGSELRLSQPHSSLWALGLSPTLSSMCSDSIRAHGLLHFLPGF